MRTIRTLIAKLRDDRGSAGLEIAILAPALAAVLVLLAAAGRLALAGNAVESAASAAAREASLARTTAQAQDAAEEMARISMEQSGVNCTTLSVNIDASGLSAPIGTTGRVSATVSCTVATWSRRTWRPSLNVTTIAASSSADCTVAIVRTDCSAPPTSVRPPAASCCV